MKRMTEKKNSIAGLAALLVIGIFAVCVLLVLLQGGIGAGGGKTAAESGIGILKAYLQIGT